MFFLFVFSVCFFCLFFFCFVLFCFFFFFFFFFFLFLFCFWYVRLQVWFIPLRFRYFCRRFSFRTVDLSRESRVMPPHPRFSRKRIEIIFRRHCRPGKLKSAKNNRYVFETKPRKFGDAKISHFTVYL